MGEIEFNKELSSARVAVRISVACAVLHNFRAQIGDNWDDDFCNDDNNGDQQNPDYMQDGEDIRELLKDYLN